MNPELKRSLSALREGVEESALAGKSKWYHFGKFVNLFHGTSSAFLPAIYSEGIKPPSKWLDLHIARLLKTMMGETPNRALLAYVIKEAGSLRRDTAKQPIGSVIYLTPRKEQSEAYARSAAKHGGEIQSDVWRYANIYLNKHHGTVIPAPHEEGEPVILEVRIPTKWVITYNDLKAVYKRAKAEYDDPRSTFIQRKFPTLGDWLDDSFHAPEVRVTHPIPPDMIVHSEVIHESLSEASLPALRRSTTAARTLRAEHCKFHSFRVSRGEDRITTTFSVESREWSEKRVHHGYVMLTSDGEAEVTCTCLDYLYRWEHALSEAGSAIIIHSNGEPALITNPQAIPGLCKHIYAASNRLLRQKGIQV